MTAKPAPSQRPLATVQYQMTLSEIAQEMGITKERVRQLQTRALNKLRKGLSQRGYGPEDITF